MEKHAEIKSLENNDELSKMEITELDEQDLSEVVGGLEVNIIKCRCGVKEA